MSSLLSFSPFDTLWFREGRPFEQMDEGLAEARSVFPPSPSTLAGAVATTINPLGSSPRSVDCMPQLRLMVLGDLEAQDQITFSGPFLLDLNGGLYVPAPATLAARKLARGDDLGEYRKLLTRSENLGIYFPAQGQRLDADGWLPRLRAHPRAGKFDYDNLATMGAWIGLQDFFRHMKSVRSFMGPDPLKQPIEFSDSFAGEQRVGIGLDPEERTAADGQLYSAQHIRPHRGSGQGPLLLSMFIDHADSFDSNGLDGKIINLGGKGRPSRLGVRKQAIVDSMPSASPELRNSGGQFFFRLTAMTPVPVTAGPWGLASLARFFNCSDSDIEVHTALMPRKAAHIGIWNRLAADGHVRKIVRCHAPGTVWFVSVAARCLSKEKQKTLARDVLAHRFVPEEMQSFGAMGFGMLALGDWPKDFNS